MGVKQRARRITIVSGKGGVGKTLIAANLAAALGQAGGSTLVMDSDLGLANLDVILGLSPRRTLHDVLAGTCSLQDAIIHIPTGHGSPEGQGDGFDVLPAGSGMFEATRLTASAQQDLKKLLDRLESCYDFLLFDAGAGIGDVVLFFARLADEILLVVTPEPTSMTDAYATMKVLVREHGRHDMQLIVNQTASGVASDTAGAAVASHLQQVASKFLDAQCQATVRLHLLGTIPSDPAVPKAIARQQLLKIASPDAPATLAFVELAKAVGRLAGRSPAVLR